MSSGILYLFCNKKNFKVGVTTTSVHSRLKTVMTYTPDPIRYIYTMSFTNRKIAFEAEAYIKNNFANYKSNTEWFRKEKGVILDINEFLFNTYDKNLSFRSVHKEINNRNFNLGSEREIEKMPKNENTKVLTGDKLEKFKSNIYKKYGL